MEDFTILNYQGRKNNLGNFIIENIKPYIKEDKAIFDIFSGSASVSNMFRKDFQVFANDSEMYASIIADTLLNHAGTVQSQNLLQMLDTEYQSAIKNLAMPVLNFLNIEQDALNSNDYIKLSSLYNLYPTVWNSLYSDITGSPISVKSIRNCNDYYLFTAYYATNYYGIIQALDIDCIIKIIHNTFPQCRNVLLSCLFYAMKEAVFSKDGHMAQPLNPLNNQKRLFSKRKKNIYKLFIQKYKEYTTLPVSRFSGRNKVFNSDFEELLDKNLFSNIGLVYADPPYTDMQYSRYYHLLNVAARYNYPDLTKTKNGYTKGLYTEGRYQSKLSNRSYSRQSLATLVKFCAQTDTNLAISYAYPEDSETQPTGRYIISIDELEGIARKYYTDAQVNITSQLYSHANHRNNSHKKVLEYLILCGNKNLKRINIGLLKNTIKQTVPSKNNPVYNSHIYWSQKPYNICDILISSLSNKGDVVFDPFLGSGVTVLESVKTSLSRCAIGCDINDMPLFIPKLLLSVNNVTGIKDKLEDFISKIEKLKYYYETLCPVCNKTGIISKVIFDKPQRAGQNILISGIHYKCQCTNRGVKQADKNDYIKINIKKPLKNIQNTSLLYNSKIAVTKNDDIKNIFTCRNLAVLDEILSIIKGYNKCYQDILKYILMSVLHLCKITDIHSNSQWPLWIPKTGCIERNIINIYTRKTRKFYDVIPFMEQNYANAEIKSQYKTLGPGKCMLLQKGSQLITEQDIPDAGADLIITDPPYLGQVLYSEYMQLYKPFLGLGYNLKDEIIVSQAPSRNKNRSEYFKLIEQVFYICSKKLKQDHYLCLYFHDSNLGVWSELIRILERNCFKFITQIHINKTNTIKNIINPKKSLNGDSVLIFTRSSRPVVHNNDKYIDISMIEHEIEYQAKTMLKSHGPLPTPGLYDNGLMETLIHNGWLDKLSEKYSSLTDIFEKYLTWDSSTSTWKE